MYESVKEIERFAQIASDKAIKQAKENNVPIAYLSGTNLIKEFPDGSSKIVGSINKYKRTLKKKIQNIKD